jgi:uncharacterized protein YjbJ (UPF0337 family)
MGATAMKIKGKLKEIEGKVTGDRVRQAEGKVEEVAGKIGASVRSGVRKAKLKVANMTAKTKVGRKAAAAKAMP